ncbi:MAG TPA: prolyl oligopeptidase family serine peptidase [Gemmatimonadales bacterium]
MIRRVLFLSFVTAACAPTYPAPPRTRQQEVVDVIHGVEFTDPYRWLEDQASPETRAWIDAQNAYAEQVVGETRLRAELRARFRALMDTPDKGAPRRGGDFEYFTLRRIGEELATVYRRPVPAGDLPVPIDPAEEYEVVIDPHPMSADLTTQVEVLSLSSDGRFMLYSVREGGQDEVSVRLRDLRSGTDLPDSLPRALYSSTSFDNDGRGYFYSARSRETGARVRYHRIGGTGPDESLFGEGYGPTAFVSLRQADRGRVRIFTVSHGWARTEVHVQDMRRDRTPRPIVTDAEALFDPQYIDGKLYVRTNLDAPNYRVVIIDPARPGPAQWREFIPEAEDVLQSFSLIGEQFYANYLHEVSAEIRVFERDGTPAGEVDVPPFHSAGIRGAGEGRAMLTLASYHAPSATYLLNLATGEREVYDPEEVPFDPTGVVVEQHWYQSRDGTRVPMYVVHREDVVLDGDNPTLLNGYGGFNVALAPRFDVNAAIWVEHGGVYAIANLRGGSEFGETWHRDGMLENKQHVFDDFIAAAEWLIDNGYTRPERLAIRGGSNGGLLVGSALTQRPELFRAVFCGFPDLDMVRFNAFTETNNMPALLEYGDASIPEQFAFLRAYSPYQHVEAGTRYPAVMLTSGDLDTRVPPLQARKMTARLQAATRSGRPVVLRYHPMNGHAARRGRPFSRIVEDAAVELAFLLEQLGVETGGPVR